MRFKTQEFKINEINKLTIMFNQMIAYEEGKQAGQVKGNPTENKPVKEEVKDPMFG